MNWLLIVVLLVLAASVISGYHRGLLRMLYSLVAWAIVFIFVTWVTPYINTFLMDNTPVYQQIEEQFATRIKESAQKKADEQQANLTDSTNSALEDLGVKLPATVLDRLAEQTSTTAGDFLEASGIYDEIAKELAGFVVQGIAILLAITASQIILHMIGRLLGVISHIPILKGINQTLGLFAGGIWGLLLVWIAFFVITLCSASEAGKALITYINESQFLTYLYENNLVLTLLMLFL